MYWGHLEPLIKPDRRRMPGRILLGTDWVYKLMPPTALREPGMARYAH